MLEWCRRYVRFPLLQVYQEAQCGSPSAFAPNQCQMVDSFLFPVLQVQGAGFAMVGEQMLVSLVTAAAHALMKAEVAVKAEYLEGGGHSELQILVDNGDGTTQPLQVCRHNFFVD